MTKFSFFFSYKINTKDFFLNQKIQEVTLNRRHRRQPFFFFANHQINNPRVIRYDNNNHNHNNKFLFFLSDA